MCLAQGPQHSEASEAWTRGPSVSSQALYHGATALPRRESRRQLSCIIAKRKPQEDMSQHNWKIADWEVKNQIKQKILESP